MPDDDTKRTETFNLAPDLYLIPKETIKNWENMDDSKEILLTKSDIDRLFFTINHAFMAINNINQCLFTGIPSHNTEAHKRIKLADFNFLTGLNELRRLLETIAASTFIKENNDAE